MSELKKIEVVQNNAIKIITGLLRSTPIEAIQMESGIFPVELVTRQVIVRYVFRVLSYPSNHLITNLFRNCWDSIGNIN